MSHKRSNGQEPRILMLAMIVLWVSAADVLRWNARRVGELIKSGEA